MGMKITVCRMRLPTFAKPVLYEVPTYLAESSIGILNRKTKRKKAMEYKAKLDYPQLAETLTVEEQLKAMTDDRNLLWECYNSILAERNKYLEALEAIANEEGSCCQRCEGNGSLWADGKAHLPSYGGATVRCGNCGGEGRVYEDVKQIAIDALP